MSLSISEMLSKIAWPDFSARANKRGTYDCSTNSSGTEFAISVDLFRAIGTDLQLIVNNGADRNMITMDLAERIPTMICYQNSDKIVEQNSSHEQ
jgi:hypothetical protein